MVEAKRANIDIEHAQVLLHQDAGRRQRSHARLARFVVLFLLVAVGVYVVPWAGHDAHSIEERTHRILARTPLIGKAYTLFLVLIDTHNDLPIAIRGRFHNQINADNFTFRTDIGGHTDVDKIRRGKLGGQFWSVFVGCPKTNETAFADSVYYKSIHDTLQQIDVIHRLADAYPDVLEFVSSASEIIPAFRRGKVASLLGIEGLHQIGNSAAILRQYYQAGVRYATLTHSCPNIYADSASAPPVHDGLSTKGKQMVREFNRMGMMVDLSHVSADTMRDAISISKAPPFFSHSSAYAVCEHERNVPDDVLLKVKEGNGAVCVNFYSRYVRCEDPEGARLSDVADHIEYIGKLIGYEHICLGSDFDGIEIAPAGLDDVSKYPDLVAELLRRGIADADVEKVVGLNTIRVLRDTEKVAEQLKEKLPLEEEA